MKKAFLPILTGVVLGAIAYWTQPYSNLNVQESTIIPTMWTAGAFFGALALMFVVKEEPWRIALYITGGFVLAVLCRIVFDITFVDSTHHNLAPFEIGFCAVFVLPFAFAGAYLYLLIRKLKN